MRKTYIGLLLLALVACTAFVADVRGGLSSAGFGIPQLAPAPGDLSAEATLDRLKSISSELGLDRGIAHGHLLPSRLDNSRVWCFKLHGGSRIEVQPDAGQLYYYHESHFEDDGSEPQLSRDDVLARAAQFLEKVGLSGKVTDYQAQFFTDRTPEGGIYRMWKITPALDANGRPATDWTGQMTLMATSGRLFQFERVRQ